MRRFAVIMAVLAALTLWVVLSGADSISIGGYTLKGAVLDLEETSIGAHGKAILQTDGSYLTAENITISLSEDKNGKLTVQKADASGSVTIHAKQAETRIVDAKARAASMRRGEDTVVLTGDVRVQVTDPRFDKPAQLRGEKVTVYLKQKRIVAERSPEGQAELNIPKPSEKKQEKK